MWASSQFFSKPQPVEKLIRERGAIFHFTQPVLVFDLSPAAHEERVEAVAKALWKRDGWPNGNGFCTWSHLRPLYISRATTALSALHEKL
jgi:hypothetical protein